MKNEKAKTNRKISLTIYCKETQVRGLLGKISFKLYTINSNFLQLISNLWATWAHACSHPHINNTYVHCTQQYHCYDVQFSSLHTCGTSHPRPAVGPFPFTSTISTSWIGPHNEELECTVDANFSSPLCALPSVTLSTLSVQMPSPVHIHFKHPCTAHPPSNNQTKISH